MKIKTLLLAISIMFAASAFSQHADGKYSFKNSQGMKCDLNFSDGGWKVSIKLNMGNVAPGKTFEGTGEWMNQGGGHWYQINTSNCSFDFDEPSSTLKLTLYDCTKSGMKEAKYTLSKI